MVSANRRRPVWPPIASFSKRNRVETPVDHSISGPLRDHSGRVCFQKRPTVASSGDLCHPDATLTRWKTWRTPVPARQSAQPVVAVACSDDCADGPGSDNELLWLRPGPIAPDEAVAVIARTERLRLLRGAERYEVASAMAVVLWDARVCQQRRVEMILADQQARAVKPLPLATVRHLDQWATGGGT